MEVPVGEQPLWKGGWGWSYFEVGEESVSAEVEVELDGDDVVDVFELGQDDFGLADDFGECRLGLEVVPEVAVDPLVGDFALHGAGLHEVVIVGSESVQV